VERTRTSAWSVAGRRALAGAVLSLAVPLLAACGPDPAGSGGVVGHMSGTSDVAGLPGNPDIGGGGLAVIPIAAMDGPFWELTGAERVADPQAWVNLAPQLSEAQVVQMGGTVAPIEDDGDFRLIVPPGEHLVCYWSGDMPGDIGGTVWGCAAVELPTEGELKASWGEGGFHIGVAR